MRGRAAGAALALALAGCGGGGSRTLLADGPWQVVLRGGKAEVLHDGRVASARGIAVEILGPKPGQAAPNPPQVAITMRATRPLVDAILWVDGNRLLTKGGGTATNGTIYGAPSALAPGTHTAVGYARTATAGVAVAWRFRVP